jgi:hypothetical protein
MNNPVLIFDLIIYPTGNNIRLSFPSTGNNTRNEKTTKK